MMRKHLAALGALLLAACQTVPTPGGFSIEQIETLESEGFLPIHAHYELGLSNKVLFDFDQSELNPEMASTLDRLAKTLIGVGIGGATIGGYTDNRGAADYNLKLSKKRAEEVKSVLASGGMDPSAITTVGYGETDSIENNATKEGRAENRRVVIIVSPGDVIRYRD